MARLAAVKAVKMHAFTGTARAMHGAKPLKFKLKLKREEERRANS
jgi:hypothetical protein